MPDIGRNLADMWRLIKQQGFNPKLLFDGSNADKKYCCWVIIFD